MPNKTEDIITRYEKLKSERGNFETYWQSLHDYFYVEAPNINKAYYPGTELDVTYLYDATTLEAADVFASGFMSYLTPPTSKWFKLRHSDAVLSQNKDVNDYLGMIEEELYHAFNRSNFYQSMHPIYKSSGVYGTGSLLEEEDADDDIRFRNLPIKQVLISEDARGRINECYVEFEYTALQAALRWGLEKLSQDMQEEVKQQKADKKHLFVLYIAERNVRDVTKKNNQNMPIQAVWIDKVNKHVVEESGYSEWPVMTHRFDKRPGTPWGFSPAMKALPFARTLNAIAKTNLRAMMKQTDPPMAAPHNAFIMPFNGNPRAMNYYNKNIMDGNKAIFPFANYGDVNVGLNAIEMYTHKVKMLMYNDVFLAFQDLGKQMNNPEVYERINEKMSMLGPAVGRFTSEVLNPIIIRTVSILSRRGKLPPPPDEMLQYPTYEIDYVSALAQAQKRSQLNSLSVALQMAGQMATFSPEVLDKIDPDATINETWDILGAPTKVLRDDREVEAIRENRAQQQAAMQQLEVAGVGAQAAKTAAEADKTMAETINSSKARRPFE